MTCDLLSRVPLLAGEVDSSIEKFSELEEAICGSLASWGGNLYFKVV